MRVLHVFSVVVALSATLLAANAIAQGEGGRPRVLAVEFANDVNPVTQDYLTDAIERANDERYDAVVLLTDTPGGLDTSMRAIIKAELESRVPVVLYVYPPGSRAASAGVFLAMAADVAAMAPSTNLGSSTPISSTGEEIPEDLRRKVVNDAAAFARELAEDNGRNGDWAESAVRRASNLGAREALRRNVIDVVADDVPSLLEKIDGTRTKSKGIVLRTAGADVETVSMSLWKRALDTLIDPNLIVLLMSIGLLGITVEVLNPGLIFPGTIGAISLVIGLFGLQVLPVSWAGVLLLVLALAFFAAEAFVVSHGALSLAGAVSFVVGALLLFDPAGDAYQVSIWVALAIGGTLAAAVGLAITKIVQVRRSKPQTGEEEMIGDVGVARTELAPDGLVFVHGELWRAHALDGPIGAGERVRIERIDEGLVLGVDRERAAGPEPAPEPAEKT